MIRSTLIVCLFGLSAIVWAESLPFGTWVKRGPEKLTMTVEPAGSGRRITYTMAGAGAPQAIGTLVSQLDGKDAMVMVAGKPSGQTMAIREIDGRHVDVVLKFQGKEVGTSKGEVSADGKLFTVEYSTTGANGQATKTMEYWDKK